MKRSDFEHPVWLGLKAEIEKRLAEGLAALESPALPFDRTQVYRGRIAALRDLLALETAPASDARPAIKPRGHFEPYPGDF